MNHFHHIFPFTAIVGQERMKLALVLNAINPSIGGVLIRGEKGTAKSTAARALSGLLPERQVADGCIFGCDPENRKGLCAACRDRYPDLVARSAPMKVVELPVSATEDKVVGTLDISHALKTGEKKFEPGILAKANRNILYVDEVNLLNDHIVDVLLDVAAMGVNVVEREGVSYTHPSSFILIGTMNPEEGELRPQLLDRFGLCVEIEGLRDSKKRLAVIQRRIAYESDPEGFCSEWAAEESALRERIAAAKKILPEVVPSREILELIVQICIDMEVDGHRADIVMIRTASAIAACNGRREVAEDDVRRAADLVLSHRMRKRPFSSRTLDKEKLDRSVQRRQNDPVREKPHDGSQQQEGEGSRHLPDGSGVTQFAAGTPFSVDGKKLDRNRRPDEKVREGCGRRSVTGSRGGRYVGSRLAGEISADIAFDATIRAAAPRRGASGSSLAVTIEPEDIRVKVRERKLGTTTVFVVDASGSMGVRRRMSEVKAAVLSLLVDAYQKRDRVGLVAFRGNRADVLLPPTSSVELAEKHLAAMPTGGTTPLAQGLMSALMLIERERRINRDMIPRLVLISDGKANVAAGERGPFEEALAAAGHIREAEIPSLVIDPEQGLLRLGLAERLSGEMGAQYLSLAELRAETIAGAVRGFGM